MEERERREKEGRKMKGEGQMKDDRRGRQRANEGDRHGKTGKERFKKKRRRKKLRWRKEQQKRGKEGGV